MNEETNKGWIAWFTRNPVAANLLMLVILVAGAITTVGLRIEDFPAQPPNRVNIEVSYDSGSATAAETGVTLVIEEALQGVQGIKQVASTSHSAGSSLTVERTSGYDLDTLVADIKTKVDAIATMPASAERPVISRDTEVEEVVTVQIYGDSDIQTLQQVARNLRLKLLAADTIETVETPDARTPEITISVDEATLQSQHLTLDDIARRINAASLIEPGGELYSADGLLVIKADYQRFRQREFENIVVKQTADGRQLTLGAIAHIDDSYNERPVLSRYNGYPSATLNVRTSGNINIVDASREVAEVVASFRDTVPHGIGVVTWADDSNYIASRLVLLLNNGLLGVGLVLLLLALFLNIRVAFWVACGLPVAFAGALTLMGPDFYNLSLNELTTFGFIIALGIVVDDAVVVGESIYAARERGGERVHATITGVKRVATPTIFGVLTSIVAFMSLTLVEGELGKIFAFFAYTAAFCLVFSLIESKFILPAHLATMQLQGDKPQSLPERFWGAVQRPVKNGLRFFTRSIYRPLIEYALDYRYAVLLLTISVVILVGGMVLSGKIRAVFFPDIPSDYITVQLELENDAGYGLTHSQAARIERAAFALGEELQREHTLNESVFVHLQTLATSDTSASVTAELSPRDERPVGTNEIVELWRERIGNVEGVRRLKFVTSFEDEEDINIELRSASRETLAGASRTLREALQSYVGVSGINNSYKAGQPQIDLTLRAEGRALGLSVADLASQVQQAYQGREVQRFQRGKDEVKVVLRYPDHQRARIDDLSEARIRTPGGDVVPLTAVAEISSRYVANEIQRTDGSRVATITGDVDKSIISPGEIIEALQSEVFTQLLAQYPNLEIRLDGEASEEAETSESLGNAFIIALMVIYALLAIPLKSYVQPLLIMTAIPFGIVGALIGHWLYGVPVSLLSMFGFLALSGVVINDSLLLINRYNQIRRDGSGVRDAIVEAACDRMRAVLLTSMTTFIGLTPLMAETSEQAQILIPAAIAMAYGILFGTVITLVLIPVLVVITEDLTPRTFDEAESVEHDSVRIESPA